jgi:hypothetical protein
MYCKFAPLAQLDRASVSKPRVGGSNPPGRAIFYVFRSFLVLDNFPQNVLIPPIQIKL